MKWCHSLLTRTSYPLLICIHLYDNQSFWLFNIRQLNQYRTPSCLKNRLTICELTFVSKNELAICKLVLLWACYKFVLFQKRARNLWAHICELVLLRARYKFVVFQKRTHNLRAHICELVRLGARYKFILFQKRACNLRAHICELVLLWARYKFVLCQKRARNMGAHICKLVLLWAHYKFIVSKMNSYFWAHFSLLQARNKLILSSYCFKIELVTSMFQACNEHVSSL